MSTNPELAHDLELTEDDAKNVTGGRKRKGNQRAEANMESTAGPTAPTIAVKPTMGANGVEIPDAGGDDTYLGGQGL